MYRAVARKAHRQGIAPEDARGLEALCARTRIEIPPSTEGVRVLVDGEDWTDLIRGEEAGALASRFSENRAVREALTRLQVSMARNGGVVVEGRDAGSVVFPAAEAKFFLVASLQERARRRRSELQARGQERSLEAVMQELKERDIRDEGRSIAPLVRPEGAVEIDTTRRTIEDVVEQMARTVAERAGVRS